MAKDGFTIDNSDFKKKMNNMQNKFPNHMRYLIEKLELRLLAKTRKLTPVDTGLLRRTWFLGSPTASKKDASIEIKNNTSYGADVEYGRKTRNGGFVAGRFMLTKALKEMERQAPDIIDPEMQNFINKNGGG